MSTNKLSHLKEWEKIYLEVEEEDDPDGYWTVPSYCLAPYFDDEEISDTNRIISGKEAKIVIDGKEYTCVIK